MPELPDLTLYIEHLRARLVGQTLIEVEVATPFLLRSVEPILSTAHNQHVIEIRRLGKRIAIGLDNNLWLLLHLMIAGRLHWRTERTTMKRKNNLAQFIFSDGIVLLTEAGHKKRASLYLLDGETALAAHDPGGLEPLDCTAEEFASQLRLENKTVKRALATPRLFSGIGNAYSDEILHAARLSPMALTRSLSDDEIDRLHSATQDVLSMWCDRLRKQSGSHFPEKVTAFRDEMNVHGKFGNPCSICSKPVQRIRYKSNETNYCAECQTGGKVLADRSLSRLLKDSWPREI